MTENSLYLYLRDLCICSYKDIIYWPPTVF